MNAATPTVAITANELIEEIVQDVTRLKYFWDNFRYLYASDKTNVDILNAVAPGLFAGFYMLMFDDAILRISRLTDPAGNPHQENVSLEQLLHATGWETADPARWQKFRTMLDELQAACKPCRTHRDKRVSHKDLSVFTKVRELPVPMMKMIDDAEAAIQRFVGTMYEELEHASYSFSMIINGERDVEQFIRHLRNRASQKMPNAVSIILYESGTNHAVLHCAFCAEKTDIPFYPNGQPTPRRMARGHYDGCYGVIGCETITVETVDRTGAELPQRFTVDLTVPTRETDP